MSQKGAAPKEKKTVHGKLEVSEKNINSRVQAAQQIERKFHHLGKRLVSETSVSIPSGSLRREGKKAAALTSRECYWIKKKTPAGSNSAKNSVCNFP